MVSVRVRDESLEEEGKVELKTYIIKGRIVLNDMEIIANNKPAPQMFREDNEMQKRKHEFEPIIFNNPNDFYTKYMLPKLDTDDVIAIDKI